MRGLANISLEVTGDAPQFACDEASLLSGRARVRNIPGAAACSHAAFTILDLKQLDYSVDDDLTVHKITVSSSEPETIILPSCEMTTLFTPSV